MTWVLDTTELAIFLDGIITVIKLERVLILFRYTVNILRMKSYDFWNLLWKCSANHYIDNRKIDRCGKYDKMLIVKSKVLSIQFLACIFENFSNKMLTIFKNCKSEINYMIVMCKFLWFEGVYFLKYPCKNSIVR